MDIPSKIQEPQRDAYTQNLLSFDEIEASIPQSYSYEKGGEMPKEFRLLRNFHHFFAQYFNLRSQVDKINLRPHYKDTLHKLIVEYFVAYLEARKLLNFDYREGFKHVGDYAEKFVEYYFQKFRL